MNFKFYLNLSSYIVCVSCSVVSALCNPMGCSPPDPLPTEFSREEHCSGLPFPSPKWPHGATILDHTDLATSIRLSGFVRYTTADTHRAERELCCLQNPCI